MRAPRSRSIPADSGPTARLRSSEQPIKASVALVRTIQPALPFLTRSAVGRTALLAQFSARPWKLDSNLVLTERRGFKSSSSLDDLGAPVGVVALVAAISWPPVKDVDGRRSGASAGRRCRSRGRPVTRPVIPTSRIVADIAVNASWSSALASRWPRQW